jgi:hypothetical protein
MDITSYARRVICFLLLLIVLFLTGITCAQDSSETVKIQYLIASIGELNGARFIRNGSEYDAQAAASHLQLKLKTAGSKVKTVEDFIQYCASKSSISGEPYLIRLADGTTLKSEVFFRNKLKAFPSGNSH